MESEYYDELTYLKPVYCCKKKSKLKKERELPSLFLICILTHMQMERICNSLHGPVAVSGIYAESDFCG